MLKTVHRLLVFFILFFPFTDVHAIDYTYDGAGRLVGADYGHGKAIFYQYDPAGNLLLKSVTRSAFPIPTVAATFGTGAARTAGTAGFSIMITLDAGLQVGQLADWWIVAYTPEGWYYLSPDPLGWQPMSLESVPVTLQIPLFDLPAIDLGVLPGLPLTPGLFAFCFVVDGNADGIPDFTWWDYSVVTIP